MVGLVLCAHAHTKDRRLNRAIQIMTLALMPAKSRDPTARMTRRIFKEKKVEAEENPPFGQAL
jgi:hypothetical protein